jgi:2-dehydro-3-deoxyphosphogluconate aldolase / (4S)-4-hydroxy-2-oxoglutarate aldolase
MSLARVADFSAVRVVPVLTPSSMATGVTVSRILFEAGLRIQEITMRSSPALETIRALRRDLPELVVGAGSILTPRLGEDAIQAGAQFLVSPGTTETLLQFAAQCDVPFVPGVASVSEIMRVQALGCELAKLFPAQALGGISFLRCVAGPLPSMKFCPTGDISAGPAADYLALTNVAAVAGSWMAPKELVDQGRFADIRRLAEQAAAL